MDTRLLYVLSITVATLSGWVYYSSGRQASTSLIATGNIDYTAKDIHLLQTGDDGLLQARTTAKALRHYTNDDQTQLDQLQSIWYQAGLPRATLAADHAIATHAYQTVKLHGHVHVHQAVGLNRESFFLQTASLTGYPKHRLIETDQPVLMISNQGQMQSQGMRVDFAQGDYQFNRIRIQYAPSSLRP
jgi:lipopolysaccharide export system protein LptC